VQEPDNVERFICIHGHFYQPPRENPWLEVIESQDSAHPYHDWNERITAECYAPNAVARILGSQDRIAQIVNNYARISFNFGPTLLSWLAEKSPDVYRSILEADHESRGHFGGHGSALAQVYNHMIMPLANRRDKYTQAFWGLRDFRHRFGRKPEGMWLAETAVDMETLDVLAELGIRFTILAPNQAAAVRKIKTRNWQDVSGSRVDPSTAYEVHVPSKRRIAVFFYDGPISRAVAFEGLLTRGEHLAQRLTAGFAEGRDWPQLMHIATDGESYGHHHRYGEMALAYALQHIRTQQIARLTNYGQYLAMHPPRSEARIHECSSWSCVHGVERWRSDCGCNAGRAGWNQAWRGPLREAFDWLRDTLAPRFEQQAGELLTDPWAARNDYIDVVLDRRPENVDRFLREHAPRTLDEAEQCTALKLLELQRHAMLMYTSCGWFFDELSGLETVQVMEYAARAVQLGEELFQTPLEPQLLELLAKAKSNLPEHGDGRRIYQKLVRPKRVELDRLAAHYAISHLWEPAAAPARIFCYAVEQQDAQNWDVGRARLVAGRARFTSTVTRESQTLVYGATHFGDHNVSGGIAPAGAPEAYQDLVRELSGHFLAGDFSAVVRSLERVFGGRTCSLRSLFHDEQRQVIQQLVRAGLEESHRAYQQLYERYVPMMRLLLTLGIPLPRPFQAAAECYLNPDLRWPLAPAGADVDLDRVHWAVREAERCHLTLDKAALGHQLSGMIHRLADALAERPTDSSRLEALADAVQDASTLPFELNLWRPQNVYYQVLQRVSRDYLHGKKRGDPRAARWLEQLVRLGDTLGFQVSDLQQQIAER
jgi:alpha-amylase/alpha-mannosidase (GH57 family)